LNKLKFMDRLMRSLRGEPPRTVRAGPLCTPVEEMDLLLANHYGQRAERYREAAQGYVDDKLREVFPAVRSRNLILAGDLLRKHREELVKRVTRWSGLAEEEGAIILSKLEDRADALGLTYAGRQESAKAMDVVSLATALAMDYAYTGRLFTG